MNESLRYYRSLLQSWGWRKLRRRKLNASVWCERCVAEGKAVPNLATDIHHVTPVMSVAPDKAKMRALFFDVHNLQALCPACHKLTHEEMRMHLPKDKRDEARRAALGKFTAKFFDGGGFKNGGG